MRSKIKKNAVITGASSGIGKATAELFASRGYGLFLTSRRLSTLEELKPALLSSGAMACHLSSHDLSIPGSGRELVEEALEAMGCIDILICCAGYGKFGPIEEVEAQEMARMWQVNYQSAYESILAVLPHFKQRKTGQIILVSSINGKKGMAGSAAYSATKFAQVGLGESLWAELREFGIKVSVVCPGYTETEFHSLAASHNPNLKSRSGRGQSPLRVARAIESAAKKGTREIHLTFSGKLILLLERISNGLAVRIMAIAAKKDPLRKIND